MENVRLQYLGHMIVLRGLEIQQTKVDVLYKILAPIDVPQLCALLGLANHNG